MRHKPKLDGNHIEIVERLRQLPGVSVVSLAGVGNGCGDILVGYHNLNFLIEIKDPAQPPSKRALTEAEQKFCQGWRGQYRVCETFEDCCRVIGYPLK